MIQGSGMRSSMDFTLSMSRMPLPWTVGNHDGSVSEEPRIRLMSTMIQPVSAATAASVPTPITAGVPACVRFRVGSACAPAC